MNFKEYFYKLIEEQIDDDVDLDFSIEVTDATVQNLFAVMWADWMEEEVPSSHPHFKRLSGMDILEVAPKYQQFMNKKEARMLENKVYGFIAKFEEVNGNRDLKELYYEALKKDKQSPNSPDSNSTPEMFGYLSVMQMMGHGVGWRDYHIDPQFNYPYVELSYLEFPNSFPEINNKGEDDDIEDWEREGEDWKGDDFSIDSGEDWKK